MRRYGPALMLAVVLIGGWVFLRPGTAGPGDPSRTPVSAAASTSTATSSSAPVPQPSKTITVIGGPTAQPRTAPAPKPGAPLTAATAARGFFTTWRSWSYTDTSATLAARARPYVTAAFEQQLQQRSPAQVWPVEWQGASQSRGHQTTLVTQLVINPDAPDDASNRYFLAALDATTIDARGQVLVHRSVHSSVWVVRQGPTWRVASDAPAG